MATRKTMKKAARTEATPVVEEKNLFQKMAEQYPVKETEIDVGVGTVTVRSRIGIGAVSALISLIVEMCVDGQTGEVRWELVEYLTKLMVCCEYCGLPAPDVEDGFMGTVGENRLYERIAPYLDHCEQDMIMEGVWQRLRARQEMNVATGVGKLQELLDGVQALMDEIGKMSEGFDGEQAVAALEQLNRIAMGK